MSKEAISLSVHKYDLMSDDLMTAPEASRKWGYEESYVRQMIKKYPDRIPEGEIRMFGKTLVITAFGMEKLTGRSPKERWYFCIEKQQMIFKQVKYDFYEEALARLIKEIENLGISDYLLTTIDNQKQRVGLGLEDGTFLFVTKEKGK
ncbi:hypothetical protein D922_02755 [Enterococcus faecalis 06-MB-DW-09]|nr:hypothetical protein D922_02755 [Enterococcus faecalis 06-MB-DW-09]